MVHEQEAWLAANHAEIKSKIEDGYAAAQRDELIDAQDVVTEMTERKRALLGTTANSHDE